MPSPIPKPKNRSNALVLVLVGVVCLGLMALGYSLNVQSTAEIYRYLDSIQSERGEPGMTDLVDDIQYKRHESKWEDPNAKRTFQSRRKARRTSSDPHAVGSLAPHLVDCGSLAQLVQQGQLHDPNPGPKYVVDVSHAPTKNSFYVSLHKPAFDRIRWVIQVKKRYYEYKLEGAWADILKNAPENARVLDVGGNIGYFSFLSAAMGPFRVDAFEPNPVNLLRACESVEANQWQNEFVKHSTDSDRSVNLWQLGVSNTAGTRQFLPNRNPGAGRFVAADADTTTETTVLHVTTLDDFAQARGWYQKSGLRIEIMKIDVESHEASVLLGARRLLNQGVIRHIFMEYSLRSVDVEFQTQGLQVLHSAGYTLCGLGAMRGPKLNNIPFDALDREHFVENFLAAMKQRKEHSINLWWQLGTECKRGSGIKPDKAWDPN